MIFILKSFVISVAYDFINLKLNSQILICYIKYFNFYIDFKKLIIQNELNYLNINNY